jgi:hypothetical protein
MLAELDEKEKIAVTKVLRKSDDWRTVWQEKQATSGMSPACCFTLSQEIRRNV